MSKSFTRADLKEYDGKGGKAAYVAFKNKVYDVTHGSSWDGGDGDGYAEGGYHFLHAIRRNADITYIVHNNQVFALTKGQTSPTSDPGFISSTTPWGQIAGSFNPLAVAVALDAGFVARGYAGDGDHLSSLIQEGIRCEGFAVIDVLQPCITYNQVNTYKWYHERAYKLDDKKYDSRDRDIALHNVIEWGDHIPIGVIYRGSRPAYNSLVPSLKSCPVPVEATYDPMAIGPPLKEVY